MKLFEVEMSIAFAAVVRFMCTHNFIDTVAPQTGSGVRFNQVSRYFIEMFMMNSLT